MNKPEHQSVYNDRFTEHRDTHRQHCPNCGRWLVAIRDYYDTENSYLAPGSHYWTLVCGECVVRFAYDTRAFELRTFPLEGRGKVVAKHGHSI